MKRLLIFQLTIILFLILIFSDNYGKSGENYKCDLNWTTYEIYNPTIENFFVYNSETGELKYNHVPTITYFKGKWIALWNANTIPIETKPNQLIYMSISDDAKEWSKPELAFSSSNRSINPIPANYFGYDHRSPVQWQPSLKVVGDELWAMWSQLSFGKSGNTDMFYGTYWSVLKDPDGKWQNTKLTFDGDADILIDGKKFRIFPSQNPILTSKARFMVPINLIGPGRKDPPEGISNFERRNSVLYTDDLGESWNISHGTMCSDRYWASWEPTVWEQPDGTIGMFARNGLGPEPRNQEIKWYETLTYAESKDHGETWSEMTYVPVETVVSRMHVIRNTERNKENENLTDNSMYILTHNDARHNMPATIRDRFNLSLYFKRGNGNDFIAGPSYTGNEPIVSYPHLYIKEGQLYAIYTRGVGESSIKIAHISYLPDESKYYIFPRDKSFPDSPAPKKKGDAYHFHLQQYIQTAQEVYTGNNSFSVGVWFRSDIQGNLIDNFNINKTRGFNFSVLNGRASLQLAGMRRPIRPEHEWTRYNRWSYLGFTYNANKNEIIFYENGEKKGRLPINDFIFDTSGNIGIIGGPVRDIGGLLGDIRFIGIYPDKLSKEQHLYLFNQYASSLGVKSKRGDEFYPPTPSFIFDPADSSFESSVVIPRESKGGTIDIDGDIMKFNGQISAGIDLDDSNMWDKVHFKFQFMPLQGEKYVVATLGDVKNPTRLVVKYGELFLEGEKALSLGNIKKEFNNIYIQMDQEIIEASLNSKSLVSMENISQWNLIYLGQGIDEKGMSSDSVFKINSKSVKAFTESYDDEALSNLQIKCY